MTKEQYRNGLEKMISGSKAERTFLAENSFGLFCLYYYQDYFQYSLTDYHYDLIQDCEDLINGLIREVVWIIYREGGKTTFEKLFIIWCLTFKKRLYPNVDAFERENSERILFDVAFELVNNKRYRADFGVLFSKEKSIDEIKQNRINNFVCENGVRVEAHSTQESVRGRLHLAQRPDLLTIDDFETNKTKSSEAYTKQINDHITEAMAGMAPNGCILYCCNYLSEYGNVQWLINRAKEDKNIRVRNIPVMTDNQPTWASKYALTDEEAQKTGKVSIEDKQRQLGSLVFSYEMMNKPIDEMTAEFKKEFAQFQTEEYLKHIETSCFITIDSAVSEKESADFTGVTINRVSSENKWYINTYRLKYNSKDLIDHLFYLNKTYKPTFLGLEETTFTMAIQPFLQEEMRKRQIFFTVTPVKHKGIQKELRIRGLIPRWESKSIFLVGDNLELLDEMRVFPNGQHDDCLDSLSMQLQQARPPHRKPMQLRDAEDKENNPAI
jgi:phage terminase large subunit-like protein